MKAKRKVGGGCGFKAAVKATKNVLKKNAALTGGVANVVKVANEFKRNIPSHLGNGLYLTPYKNNSYQRALYDFELIKIARLLKIPHFIGVFTRDKLPVSPKRFESAIVNLDTVNVNDNITIPTGTYELEDLESVINKLKPDYITFFELKSDSNTLQCKISCSHEIDFSIENSIATLLGFRNVVHTTGSTHESENTNNIMKINCIKIECNLTSDSFCDGSRS
ncbi:protein ALP1-like [Aphis craccivora]|uniref:Protein ALP1-like n=1 Tax=Aphis craccivora TaxID=307492 RepID=A0A6G0VMF3_APHCR|nr:protein ALP1-like [Aphis craccivora]